MTLQTPSTSSDKVTLRSGHSYPLTGLGLWKVSQPECADLVYTALSLGYRLLDGAADYDNEVQSGEGLQRAIDDGIVSREEITVVSKLWNTFHAAEHVEPACRRSLKDWGVEYFDVYYVHMPIALKYG
jgi:D-xylose reductase